MGGGERQPTSRCRASANAAASALPPPHCCLCAVRHCRTSRCHRRCRQAAADVALSPCRHRCSIRAAASALPPLRCSPPPLFALPPLPPPPPLMLPPPPCRHQASADVVLAHCRHRRPHAVALPPPLLTLPLPPHRRQAAADVALSRCRHRHSLCAAASALPDNDALIPPCVIIG